MLDATEIESDRSNLASSSRVNLSFSDRLPWMVCATSFRAITRGTSSLERRMRAPATEKINGRHIEGRTARSLIGGRSRKKKNIPQNCSPRWTSASVEWLFTITSSTRQERKQLNVIDMPRTNHFFRIIKFVKLLRHFRCERTVTEQLQDPCSRMLSGTERARFKCTGDFVGNLLVAEDRINLYNETTVGLSMYTMYLHT